MKVKSESEVAQSCPTLSDPMDSSLPGSSIHGIFQARVLEWGAITFSERETIEGERREWKSWFKIQHSKNQDYVIWSHHFMANRETMATVADFILLGSQITVDGDCSHETERRLLLERKAMTNLDSVFKSRDITLPTKLCIVKGMVFPLVMYGYESWTIKKAEHQRGDSFELWCCRGLLRVSWTAMRSHPSILKEFNPEHSLNGLLLNLRYFGHLKWRAGSFEKTWYWERLKSKREGGSRGWDG